MLADEEVDKEDVLEQELLREQHDVRRSSMVLVSVEDCKSVFEGITGSFGHSLKSFKVVVPVTVVVVVLVSKRLSSSSKALEDEDALISFFFFERILLVP